MQITDVKQMQQYYWIQVALRGDHAWNAYGKGRKEKS
jgi:hypothetical protein